MKTRPEPRYDCERCGRSVVVRLPVEIDTRQPGEKEWRKMMVCTRCYDGREMKRFRPTGGDPRQLDLFGKVAS